MKPRKSGSRHPLLLYRRTLARLGTLALLPGLLLAGVWAWGYLGGTRLLSPQSELWAVTAFVFLLGFALLAFLGRFLAFVQPRKDHLLLATPFLRVRISYRRVRSVHPASLQQLFPPLQSSWAQRSFLEPYYGKTAVVVELSSYPLSPTLLRLFLGAHTLHRQAAGLALVVPDWMKLSTELDALLGTWQGKQQARKRPAPGSWR